MIDSLRIRCLALPAVLFAVALLVQLPGLVLPANYYDEGLTLLGADRLTRGELPYRDFWNTQSPGQIAVTAVLFRLLGPSMLLPRAFDVLSRAASTVILFLLARRVGPRPLAFPVWAAGVLLVATLGCFGVPVTQAVGLSLASLLVTVRGLEDGAAQGRASSLLPAGLLAGLAVLFRHDVGAAGALAAAATIVLAPSRPRSALGRLAGFAAGLAAVVVPVAALVLAMGTPIAHLLETFVTYPLFVYPKVRALPLPSGAMRPWPLVPELVAAGAFLFAVFRLGRGGRRERATVTLLSLALLVLASSPLALVRVDPLHQFSIRFPALALIPGLWWAITGSLRLPPASAWLGVLALVPFLLRPAGLEASALRDLRKNWREGTSHGVPRAWGVPLGSDQAKAVRTVRRRVPPDAPLFVGNTRHDRASINDALFYFLAERRCVTYYHNLLPGLVTTERVQRLMVSELARAAPPVVVLRAGLDGGQEPNQSRFPSGVTLLDDAIRSSYRPEAVFGSYQIWTRR